MSNTTIQKVFDDLMPIFQATEQSLNEWQGDGNLQFPILLGMIAVRLNWDEKQLRENDPFVRKYVRSHPDWHVTRGAKGGIMKAEDKEKKEAEKIAKEIAKQQVKAALEAKVAEAKAAAIAAITLAVDSAPESSLESLASEEDEMDDAVKIEHDSDAEYIGDSEVE